MADRLVIGVIVGAHGVRGAVRVKSFTSVPEDVAAYGPLTDEAGARTFRLTVTGAAKGVVLATLDGVTDRNAAEALRGTALHVARDRLPVAEDEDTFYHADLLGLRVEVQATGAALGAVKAVHDFGAGDVLEVTGSGGARFLPFTAAVVPEVNLTDGVLRVRLPDEVEAKED